MAEVRLEKTDYSREGWLPAICIVCGVETNRSSRQTVRESPNPVSTLGWLWTLIVHNFSERTTELIVPICLEDSGYFWKREVLIYLPIFFGFLGQVGGVLLLGYSIPGGPISSNLGGMAVLLGAFGLFAALVASSALERTGIRAVEIAEEWVRLVGVSEEFAAAVAECQAGLGGQPGD